LVDDDDMILGWNGASRNLRYNSLSYISNVPCEGVIDPCGKAGGKEDDDFNSNSGIGRLLFLDVAVFLVVFLLPRGSGSEDVSRSSVRFNFFVLRLLLGVQLLSPTPPAQLEATSTAAVVVDDIVNDG
jgi:hypothetical protein